MQAYIEELSIKGFKSFSKPVRATFNNGFSVIVGPNGSGKSNILDSLCFTLGRLSTKSLRADNYSELISRNLVKDKKKAEVSISILNDGSFPIKDKHLNIKRIITPAGQTKYKLNGKNATRKEVLDLLSRARIYPDGHNIILQGDINRFIDMTSIERRKVIEEISGIIVYEHRKEETLRELEKVNEKLKDAQIVLREKESYMDNLKSEKEEAEKYQNVINELKQNKFTLIKLKLESTKNNEESIEKEVEKIDKEIKDLEKNSFSTKNSIDKIRKELADLEIKIEKMGGGERLALQKEIENLKISFEQSKNLEENSKRELERISNRKEQLDLNLKEIIRKIEEEKENINTLKKEKEKISKKELEIKKRVGEDKLKELENELDSIEKELEELKENKLSLQEKIHSITSNIDKKTYQLEDITNKIKEKLEKSSNLQSEKKRYKEIIQNIGKAVHEDSKLAVEIGKIKKEIIKIEEELGRIRVEDKSREEFVLRDNAIRSILEVKKKGTIKGIHGTVMDLGKVDKEYSVALEVAAGNRVKNIVVDDTETAIECLNLLKRNKTGIATFLPLSKIKPYSSITLPKGEGVIGFAYDLIKSDSKYRNIFKYIFGNTIIVENIDSAKALGIGKYRMVTLEGDVFDISGAIHGGYRIRSRGLGFKAEDLSSKIEEVSGKLEELKRKRNDIESKREDIEKELEELRKEKAKLEGKIEGYDEDLEEKWEKEKSELEEDIKKLTIEKDNISKEIQEIEKNIESKNKEYSSKKESVKNLRFNGLKEELNKIRDTIIEVDSKLAQASSVLENTLLPEKNNILRVLKELEKEKSEFEKQIISEQKKRDQIKKDLENKEKEEGSFYTKLKDAFKTKNKLTEEIREKEILLEKLAVQITEKNNKKNNIIIKRAKLKAELDRLNEEIKEFKGVEEIKNVNISKIKSTVINLEEKLSGFGQVNLKALDTWNKLKEEFDNLTWKLGKLTVEKEDIEKVINEIESKKKKAFLETYNKVNDNFKRIVNKISAYSGELLLENKQNPFEGGIRINIRNNKNEKVSIASLSGGEKVIMALALIFSIQELEPAPFYLLDEIDSALDKVNSEKVAKLLKEYSKSSQVIIVSHNDSIISEADQLYGVSMSNGISSIISLKV